MKIILNEDVKNLGKKGELKEVKEGFARNFLIPKNLAKPATKVAVKKLEEELKNKEADNAKLKEEAKNKAKLLDGQKVTIQAKADKSGKLFGAISEKEIAENIKKYLNQDIETKMINVSEPIKKIGDYKTKVTLHKEIKASIDIKVVAEK